MYAVIEYTPGYLSEDDDPPVFDQFQEALNYLMERREELFHDDASYSYPPEHLEDKYPPTFELEVQDIVVSGEGDTGVVKAGFSYYDNRKLHDLGRIVEIVLVEATDEEIERSFDAYR